VTKRTLLGLFLSGLAACSDAVGPDQPEGTLLAAGSLALEWSADGREIFYYDSGYTTARVTPLPDRILAVNVMTRATRVVVASGAYGSGGAARPGIPPRVTIAGLAYLRTDGDQFALRLVTGTSDVAVVACGPWFTTTPDRSRLLYSPPIYEPFDDSIGVIDLVTGARTSVPTGPYHPTSSTAVSPDGNQIVLERFDASAGFGILDLRDSTITVLPDSLFPGPLQDFPPILLGWNAEGVWFVEGGGPPHLIRYHPASGAAHWFPISHATGGAGDGTGGTAPPTGGTIVWSHNCNSDDPLSGRCLSSAYAVWLMNPLTGVDDRLVDFYAGPDLDFPRAFFAAVSPDGQSLAYVLGNDLRLLTLR